MIICCMCDKKVPFSSLLFSPGLSVADVECPFCKAHLHAGRRSKRVIWTGLVIGGIAAGIAAHYVFHLLGWSKISSIMSIIVVSVVVAALLTSYSWWSNDFYVEA